MSFLMSLSHLFFRLPFGRIVIGLHLYTLIPFPLPTFHVNGQTSLIVVFFCDLLYSDVLLLIHLIHRLF